MQSIKLSLPVFLGLSLLISTPALASQDYHDDSYDDEKAELTVYVEVNDRHNDDDYDAEDFTIEVDGEDVSRDSFRGDEDGTEVTLDEGRYEVEVRNDRGYEVSYSSGCEGSIDEGDEERCRITLEDRENKSYFAPHFAAPAITITKGYIPALPATGFPPLSALSALLALLGLGALGYFSYPYARAAFTAVLR